MSTPPRVVIFALSSHWIGPARLPRAMQRAGFEVAVICPADSLIAKTRFVNRRAHLRSGAIDPADLRAALWELVTDWQASAIVPADDRAVQFLHDFASAVYDGKCDDRPGKDWFEKALRRSLPAQGHFLTVRQKRAAHGAVTTLGIPAPEQTVARHESEAKAFAARAGYPVVVKSDRGSAGFGVRICRDERELLDAYESLSREAGGGEDVLVEQFIAGPQASYPFVALGGKVLAGLTRLKIHAHPEPLGPSSVIEIIDQPLIASAAALFAARTRYSGFASMQFLLDPKTGPKFLEFNPRPVPLMHLDEEMCGIDWCRAWHAALAGETPPQFRGPIVGRRIALFPQEWLRDRQSPFLTTDAVPDVPWDDPALLQALLTLKP
jgi:hypothetical protein